METAEGRNFFFVGHKQSDTLRFWFYIIGSSIEANNYRYSISVTNDSVDEKYNHYGKVFTLDVDESTKGSVFMMETKAAQRIWEEDTKLNFNLVIHNLKEEAKDDNEESGVSDVSDGGDD